MRASGPVLNIATYISKPIISTDGGTELFLIMVGNDTDTESVSHMGAVGPCPLRVCL